eukprot:11698836-Ditylum_brightwellii.AAC.1
MGNWDFGGVFLMGMYIHTGETPSHSSCIYVHRYNIASSTAGVPALVFGGKGRWPVLHIDKRNATCDLF